MVTMDEAAVWVDGRYFIQAERQLDCNWILMKLGIYVLCFVKLISVVDKQ